MSGFKLSMASNGSDQKAALTMLQSNDHAFLDGRWLLYFLTVQFQLMVVIKNKEIHEVAEKSP
jgi:hypothetical protein